MSSTSLLPDNATPLETALERTIAKMLGEIPSPFPALWRPDEVPVAQLPWLAEALGVFEWDAKAPEMQKRNTLKNHWANQRQAGMEVSLKRAISPLGYGVQLKPWYEFGGSPYYFYLEIDVSGKKIDSALLSRVEDRIQLSKSERDDYGLFVVVSSAVDDSELSASAMVSAAFTDMVLAESLPHPRVIESRLD